ncbi:uncharacterized protein PRCAT00006362001 [Priceomyces carsonii]|uniref:uncharacterized protein n=1 Tax=Priceomyces carsonii TaxID=28549 RepID=UPI002EDA7C68|nr:unnamed protein product [Priceomyces carsonii]
MIFRLTPLLRGPISKYNPQKRHLFKKVKSGLTFKTEKDASFHHEYSIKPDTFAFKVSSQDSVSSLNKVKQVPKKVTTHPLQRLADSKGFSPLDFIYRNSTNYPFDKKSPQDVYNEYPLTTAPKLARQKDKPKKTKMSVSDFIEDSLYNPNYGYFSKEVEIFHPDEPFKYNQIEDVDEFLDAWQKSYKKYEEPLELQLNDTKDMVKVLAPKNSDAKYARRAKSLQREELMLTGSTSSKSMRPQLWHTPTELFQPYYGEALARYILVNYKLNGNFPYHDLVIYEMGGGNGTLMCNILNYIKENAPDIYLRTHYNIIEISDQLAAKQTQSLYKSKLFESGIDPEKVTIINKSIFKWNTVVEDPCVFIALEVFDNFPHHLIRYDNITGQPYEGKVLINDNGDLFEFFTPELSYYSNAYLQLRENSKHSVLNQSSTLQGKYETLKSVIPLLNKDNIHPLLHSSSFLSVKNSILPFKDGLTPGEFIPTSLLHFFQVLAYRFPNHSLICSDFNYLPNSIKGYFNGPVVQTMLQNRMIDVSTYMCYQGHFDIMFPTDFDIASELYAKVTKKLARVESHKEFLTQWADLDITTTKKGENPMLNFYKNVSFMVS